MFERRDGPRFVLWTTLIVLVSLMFAASESFAAGQNDDLPGNSSLTTIADRPAVDAPAFRLGDAARPFGWSTVVSDFNHDGIPDLAIADRSPRSQSGFRYEIEFAVAGQKPYDVTFTSPLQALTVQPDDVDGDRDIDIVVVDPISNDIVGVWLNDGDGHFAPADPREFSKHPLRSRLDSWCPTEGMPAAFSRAQNQDGLSRRVDAQGEPLSRERLARPSQSLSSINHASSTNPRAPPSSFQS